MTDPEQYRTRALKRLGIIAVVIVVAGIGYWYFSRSDSFQRIASLETSAEHLAVQEVSKTFSAPSPLIATSTASSSVGTISAKANKYTLTRAGVIADTNAARAQNGNLPPLAEDPTLDDIASLRLDDMFAKQYFAHISPSSSSAVTVADAVGYNYILLGENLALGDFLGDQGVVTAWMNSPGHRANILNTGYTQIGVAVGEGEFQGSNDWIAVQVFARPASACPAPNAMLQATINTEQANLATMQVQLQTAKAQIDAMNPQSGDAYNQAVSRYDALVNQYNTLLAQTKTDVTTYNSEVTAYNGCIQG